MSRTIDPVIINYLKTRKPYSYAHLIRFERPILSSQELNTTDKQYVYLTDASVDLYFNSPRVDTSVENLSIKYRANRVLEVPAIPEYSKARATAIELRLDASAIGSMVADSVNIVRDGDSYEITFTNPIYNIGFVEGDKLTIEIGVTEYDVIVTKFAEENVMVVSSSTIIPSGFQVVYITLSSEEIVALLQDKSSDDYVTFINREVQIYKVYFDENNNQLGSPYYLYKGIIQDASLEDDNDAITIRWTLNSHWGDFSEVKGRVTSDEFHRALDEHGVPQPNSAIKPIYAYDKGFIHSDTAVNLAAIYNVQIEQQDIKYKKGFFGIGAKVKIKKYFTTEQRQTELDFQLQSKALDIIYGVRPAEGTPIFADTKTDDSAQVYVAYSICEGEIAGIYDLIISDKSLICNNLQDYDARSAQTPENTVDLVCYGRADRGDVLEGVLSTTSSSIDFYDTDLLTYNNTQSLSYLTNYQGFTQPLGTSTGNIGIKHENSIKLDNPLPMTLSFYAGKSNQRAAPNLVDIAQNNNFKIQSDYWQGDDKMEYWGPNHRLLDTAYLVGQYTISEDDTTIPSIKLVVKGKFIECYNYDYSYQHYDKSISEFQEHFSIGDLVNIHNTSGSILDSNLRIINKFFIRNSSGSLEPRFSFDREPSLGYINGIPTITKFYMRRLTYNWTMVTYNHIEHSGSVPSVLDGAIISITNSSSAANYQLSPSSNITALAGGIVGPDGITYYPAVRFI